MATASMKEGCRVPLYDVDAVLAGRSGGKAVPQDPFASSRDVIFYVVLLFLPFGGPLTAFLLWQPILELVHWILGDERKLLELTQVTLTPTTNGIVVASLATALGTLTSITVWTLRQRQLDIRSNLNKEACELRLMQSSVIADLAASAPNCNGFSEERGVDPDLYFQVLALVRQYAMRVASESNSSADMRRLESQDVGDTELAALVLAIPAGGMSKTLQLDIASRIERLNEWRSMRLAALNTAFPLIHWVILALIASSIALCFLIEVDQSEGRFLSERPEDSLRLRLVFTILVGTFSGLTSLCADLNEPFRGSFKIDASSNQLVGLIAAFDKDIMLLRGDVKPNLEELTG